MPLNCNHQLKTNQLPILAIDVLLGSSVNVLQMKSVGYLKGNILFERFYERPVFLPLPRHYLAPFFGAFFSSGLPLSLPLSLMSKALSSFPRIAWFGTAFPDSYSVTTCGFSQILVAKSFWVISL